MRPPALSLAVALLALVAAGCGGDDKAPEADQVETAVVAYAHAFGDGDGDKACARLTTAARDAFVKRVTSIVGTNDCAEAMTKLQSLAGPDVTGPFESATVNDVKIDGDHATATLVAGGHDESVSLDLVGGKWLLTKAPGT
jgi:hypothetical protein